MRWVGGGGGRCGGEEGEEGEGEEGESREAHVAAEVGGKKVCYGEILKGEGNSLSCVKYRSCGHCCPNV